MADAKISALPASATPLAGTEVVPIVQSSQTKNVSVANLTAGRAVSAASLALTTSPLPVTSGGTGTATALTAGSIVFAGASGVYSQNNANFFWDAANVRLGIGTASPETRFDMLGATTTQLRVRMTGQADVRAVADTGYGAVGTYSNHQFAIRTNSTTAITVDTSQNAKLETGNLIFGTAGKGIDFSQDPNPAGMTSELLDDYEEGTWTPADASGAGLAIAITAGTTPTYVKIGRLVVCSADVTYPVTADATLARLSLPFAASATNPSGCGVVGFKTDGIAVFGSTSATGSTFLSPVNTFLTNANLSGVRFNMTWTFQV
jgi:hypothetical protein